MSAEMDVCPVCKHEQGVSGRLNRNGETASYNCPVCGAYAVPFMWSSLRENVAGDHKLCAWIRERNEQGEQPKLTKKDIEILQGSIPDYRPLEKQLKLLRAIEKRSEHPGSEVTLIFDEDFPLAYAEGADEFTFYLQALSDRGLIHMKPEPNAQVTDALYGRLRKLTITASGWDYLDRHASDLEEKTQAFVAMSFSEKMKPTWEDAIKPAILEAGYTPYRVDDDPHNENIVFKIMAEIKNSRFVVADLTEQNNGVYFEAGYGLGLGLPVMWSIRKDDATRSISTRRSTIRYVGTQQKN
jgi:transcription elongation factor Elf1